MFPCRFGNLTITINKMIFEWIKPIYKAILTNLIILIILPLLLVKAMFKGNGKGE